MDNRPIGVFDSGLGGLTAVKELTARMPEEDIIYFGDTGRVPYGTRSREIIIKYTRQDIAFLMTFDIKCIVIACGTVSTTALDAVAGDYDIPIIGVVESAASAAAGATKNGRIGIIGTEASIASRSYEKTTALYKPGAVCAAAACPLLVPLVENGRFRKGDAVAEAVVAEYLAPIKAEGVDTLIMGCTHYPLLRGIIADYMGGAVTLIDPGAKTAEFTADMLLKTGGRAENGRTGTQSFFVSDSVESFSKLGGIFLERAIEGSVQKTDIERY